MSRAESKDKRRKHARWKHFPQSTELDKSANHKDDDAPLQQHMDNDELVIADLDFDMIDEVRQTWQFYRDRRPDAYDELHD